MTAASVQSFDGLSGTAGVEAFNTLAPASGDFVVFWKVGSKVFIMKKTP